MITVDFRGTVRNIYLGRASARVVFLGIVIAGIAISPARGESPLSGGGQRGGFSESAMRRHYDDAYRLQSSGDLANADVEHKAFLAEALHHAANGRANTGDYEHAAPLYEAALKMAPGDVPLHLDYARAALDAEDAARARLLSQAAVDLEREHAAPRDAQAVALLGQSLWALGDRNAALEQLTLAATIQPDFKNIYALVKVRLWLGDKDAAVLLMARIFAKFGDSAVMRMNAGRAYATANYFPEAIEEFQAALAKDSRLAGLHYSLGAAYMSKSGAEAYPQAEAEFRKELSLHPDDTFSYTPLGEIAIARHDYSGAELDLKRAVAFRPEDPEGLIKLGDLYVEMGRRPEAESCFRKAIALTTDPSRNQYSIHTAHYQLGRLLMHDGEVAEGKREIDISAELLAESNKQDGSRLTGKPPVQSSLTRTRIAGAAEIAEERDFEHGAGPLIAGSYNNLGVHAAMRGDFAAAATYFGSAAPWNSGLAGLDNNWGRAAFEAKMYAQASGPLGRALAGHPEDDTVRSMLGVSEYMLHDYGSTLHTLAPLGTARDATPFLALAYADSMIRAGDATEGVQRLSALIAASPENAMLHRVLGEGYASNGDNQSAAKELRIAVRLDPSDGKAQLSLSASLIALGQTDEPEALLTRLADAGSQDAQVYFKLGQVHFERGETKVAISNLETAARMSPQDGAIHLALAEAYQKSERPADAKREAELSEALLAFHPPGNLSHFSRDSGSGGQSGSRTLPPQ